MISRDKNKCTFIMKRVNTAIKYNQPEYKIKNKTNVFSIIIRYDFWRLQDIPITTN